MPGVVEGLSAFNSLLRTLLAAAVVGGATIAGWFGYSTFQARYVSSKELTETQERLRKAESEVAGLASQLKLKDQQIEQLAASVKKLETSLRYLKIDYRVARFTALEQTTDSAGQVTTLIEFVELDDRGQPLDAPKQYRIQGDIVYIDGWVVKFEDKYVEEADIERGTSLLLFKRIFGSGQRPDDGYPLDEIGLAPRAYAREGQVNEFEKRIWNDFWSIANNPDLARQLGIRAAHGGAPFMKVEQGKSYKILLRASGDPTIVPESALGEVRDGIGM
jgi:hypothetical protein